jgi:hypothetical protein
MALTTRGPHSLTKSVRKSSSDFSETFFEMYFLALQVELILDTKLGVQSGFTPVKAASSSLKVRI